MTDAAIASERAPRRSVRLDSGISTRCLDTAKRNGHARRLADGCQLDLRNGGGTVGCPDCPYKPNPAPARAAPMRGALALFQL